MKRFEVIDNCGDKVVHTEDEVLCMPYLTDDDIEDIAHLWVGEGVDICHDGLCCYITRTL